MVEHYEYTPEGSDEVVTDKPEEVIPSTEPVFVPENNDTAEAPVLDVPPASPGDQPNPTEEESTEEPTSDESPS